MSIKAISVMGCGWLGLPLAEALIAQGYEVKGSTTRSEKVSTLQNKKIIPYQIILDPYLQQEEKKDFFDADLLIINIPPGIKSKPIEFHQQQMQSLHDEVVRCSKIKHVLYISSTSIYPDTAKEMVESDISNSAHAAKNALVFAEQLWRDSPSINATILRCGGLSGYDRLLIKHFAGKKNLSIGNEPVNLVHRDDVVAVIKEIIRQDKWEKTYNLCAPLHPLKKDFYFHLADQFGYERPVFNEGSPGKIVNTDKLIKELQYTFIFPDPFEFEYSITN